MRLGAAETAMEIGEIAGIDAVKRVSRKVEEQEKTIVGPKSGMTALAATVKSRQRNSKK
jgi:hypothetical protein